MLACASLSHGELNRLAEAGWLPSTKRLKRMTLHRAPGMNLPGAHGLVGILVFEDDGYSHENDFEV